jgi:hypothetical protein
MPDPTWRSGLRTRWVEEFGDRFTAQEYEQALDEVDLFRRYAERVAKEPLGIGEMPFPCLLPLLPAGKRS